MIKKKSVIALIPARGGSKGVRRKNLRTILGKSLVEISIKAALEAQKVDYVFLSSDDEEILKIGRGLGVESIIRPHAIASDFASANDVVNHFFKNMSPPLVAIDPYLIYLQPTSPLRTASHIDDALIELEISNYTTLVSVVELQKSPYKSFEINENGQLQSLYAENLSNTRRQDLPKTYMPNGAIYVFCMSDFYLNNGFPSNGSIPFIMNEADSIDIDSEEDIIGVEEYLRKKNG